MLSIPLLLRRYGKQQSYGFREFSGSGAETAFRVASGGFNR